MSFSSVLMPVRPEFGLLSKKNENETGIKRRKKNNFMNRFQQKKDCWKGKTTPGDGRLLGNTIATLKYI